MTKEEVLEVYEVVSEYWKEKLISKYPQYFENTEFEEGKIYTFGNTIFQYYPTGAISYLKDLSEYLKGNHFSNYIKDKREYCTLIERAELIYNFLLKEVERRGYVNGTMYFCDGRLCTVKNVRMLKYYRAEDQLTDGFGGSIYIKGVWAEIRKI